MTCPGDYNITLIQGDSLDKRYRVENGSGEAVSEDVVQSIVFSCSSLGIQQPLTHDTDDGVWLLTIPAKITATLAPIATTYDLTLVFAGEAVKTLVYEGALTVKRKSNPINSGGG